MMIKFLSKKGEVFVPKMSMKYFNEVVSWQIFDSKEVRKHKSWISCDFELRLRCWFLLMSGNMKVEVGDLKRERNKMNSFTDTGSSGG